MSRRSPTQSTIDGSLSEAAWSSAPKIGELIQRQPDTGQRAVASAPTSRCCATKTISTSACIAYDTEPDRVVGTQMVRDGVLGPDDRIEIVLDTFRDQRSAFYFATNPAGALVDGLAFANGQLNTDWDAIWHVRTTRTDSGWVAEFAIPFKSLSFPAGRERLGIQHRADHLPQARGRSLVRRAARHAIPSGIRGRRDHESRRADAGHRPRSAPVPRRSLAASRQRRRRRLHGKPGLDVFYSITPSLRLTATFNTDFGETEVDARQINLSRFSLLFPEKRAFFLEGAGVFSFASTGPETPGGIPGTGADLYPFFSRQIGLIGGRRFRSTPASSSPAPSGAPRSAC